MDQTSIFTNLGAAVSVDAINEDLIDDMSLGELAYARALFNQKFSERLSKPGAENDVALYRKSSGADWSGFAAQGDSQNTVEGAVEPTPPDNYVDTLPAITSLMAQHDRANDAAMTNLTRLLQIAQKDQTAYLGVPEGLRGFRDVSEIMRRQLRMSGHRAKRLQIRAKYVSHAVATDQNPAGVEPKLPNIAASYAAGNIPGESLDRIAAFDEDLTKYSNTVKRPLDYKDRVIRAFEPTLLEAAESASPEELSQARQRWAEQVAHHIDADGPPPSDALKKKPDNALHLRSHEDGSATASMHMDPVWAATLKEFLNTNLNYKGKKPLLPENIENLYEAMAEAKTAQDAAESERQRPAGTTEDETPKSQRQGPTEHEDKLEALHDMLGSRPEIDDRVPSQIEASLPQPFPADAVIVEDEQGNEYTKQQIDWIDQLTRPQRAGAILLGAINAVMSMHPKDAAAKRAHGSAAKLVIVQDIQTAHATLGLPALPQEVQRPPGPSGILPPIIKRSNPNVRDRLEAVSEPEQEFTGYANPVPWTRYQSEVVNIGPMHPGHLGPRLCDTELVGQIWNGQDIVLNEYRSKRLFTTAQRKAILARDKGCQAPGCIVQATYCQCHHIEEWAEGGETNENNSITLCPAHHPDVHNGKWTILKIDGVTYFQPAKWLDPDQPLLRNLYWNS